MNPDDCRAECLIQVLNKDSGLLLLILLHIYKLGGGAIFSMKRIFVNHHSSIVQALLRLVRGNT